MELPRALRDTTLTAKGGTKIRQPAAIAQSVCHNFYFNIILLYTAGFPDLIFENISRFFNEIQIQEIMSTVLFLCMTFKLFFTQMQDGN
jgi:hypothetical protein